MRNNIAYFLLCLILIACNSDRDAKPIQVDAGFSDYVNAFTSGVIGSKSEVIIILSEPNKLASPGNELPKGILSFEPSINGSAKWKDQQTIVFSPSETLESGQLYIAHFQLGNLSDVPAAFQEMEFTFSVLTQSVFLSTSGLSSTLAQDQTVQQLAGNLRTTDLTNSDELESCLTATQFGKALNISWIHSENGKTSEFIIDEITRGDTESFVKLELDGEPIGAENESETEIRIPPLSEFSLLDVTTQTSPNFHFSLHFSDPIQSNQDLTGLIYLKSKRGIRLDVNGNEIKVFPKTQLSGNETIVIAQGVLSKNKRQLNSQYERTIEINTTKPALALLGNGVIMPNTGKVSFPFKAVNLKAVNLRIIRIYEDNIPQFLQTNQLDGNGSLTRVGKLVYDGTVDLVSQEPIDYGVWNNFSIDISNFLKTEPGAIYRVLLNFERYQSLYPCSDSDEAPVPMKRRKVDFSDGTTYFNENYWYEGYTDWSEKDNPCDDSYYQYYARGIARNIIASNIGLIAKESASQTYDVIATDLTSTKPMANTEIIALDFQQQVLAKAKTNGDGHVRLYTGEKPYLIKAVKGQAKGYLRVDNGSALSVSLYDVGGKKINNGIKGFIYGERGVWRPGDTLHVSFMLEDKRNTLPASHPIVLELFNPQGKLVIKESNTQGVHGLYAFHLPISHDAPTGNWRAKITVGNSVFSKALKVETVKPNRLRINFDLPDVISASERVETSLETEWLYGAPGSNLEALIQMQVENMKTKFDGFAGYQFDDRTKRFWGGNLYEATAKTDKEGKANLSFDFEEPRSAPGMLKMKFNTKVFESGGDFSQDFVSTKYSPYSSYVGIKADRGENWITAINTKKSNGIAIAALDENGKPLTKEVEIHVYKLSWNWWWEGNGSDELTQYINASSQTELKSETFQVNNGKGIYNLTFEEPKWGRLLIKVIDPESGHSSSKILFAAYPGWYNNDGSGAEAAAMLSIESTQKKYDVGEEIEISVPSGGIGNLYVTVEKGDQILDQFWVKADNENTRISIEATEEMAPNIYISVCLIQPYAQEANSLPIRMYGLIPIEVNNPETHVTPIITCVDEVRPESSFEVKVTEKEGKPMAYSLAVVDEGLLSLTRFRTPNPWRTFYAKEALGIRTWDMYKYVMSVKTGKITPLLAVGGDEALEYKEDVKANRFKSVVSYLGPFFLEKGDAQKHQINIPNYIGAVRVMVVAGHQGAYGNAEKEVLVNQPLMVLPTLPRVLGPSETVRVPVNVVCMDDKIKNVEVKISANEFIEILGSPTQKVTFSKKGDKTCFFEVKVARKLGIAEMRFDVSSGAEKAFEEIELEVRAPNPHLTNSETKTISPGGSLDMEYEAIGIKGSNTTQISISGLPDMGLEKHLHYLIRYPHGCIEQTTSSVFPQLFLENLVELTPEMKVKIRENIQAGLNRLRTFQQNSGGLSYWPGSGSDPSLWGTNYAGHFIVEAKLKGYDMPPGLYQNWLKFQLDESSAWVRDEYGTWRRYGSDMVQAYRLYTLALSGNANIGAMNRLKSDAELSEAAAWRLAAAYALIGRKDAAAQLSKGSINVAPYREMSQTYGSDLRDMAMILETLAYTKETDRGAGLIQDICEELATGWHSTQTRAYAMLAIAKFIGNKGSGDSYSFELTLNGKKHSINTASPFYQISVPKSELMSGAFQIQNTSDQTLFLSMVQTGIPIEINQSPVRKDLDMTVTYLDLQGNPLDVSKIKQGQDFKAVVRVYNPGIRTRYEEVALNQIFPSGWQIVNTRVGFESSDYNAPFDYQDIRDDRVYTYFDLKRRKEKTFEVLLNATFVGKYYMPGVFCAPMYDEHIQALDAGKWVEIIE